MTGFGRAEAEYRDSRYTVEINTLNSRYLEYQIRIPKTLAPLENEVKNLLNSMFKRGKIIITITQDQEQPEDSIIGGCDFVTAALQNLDTGIQNDLFIIDNQDLGLIVHYLGPFL